MRRHALAAWALFGLGAALVPSLGCPSNACFLEVCVSGKCRCSISSCQEGAEYDTRQDRCKCSPGRFDIAGQCLTQVQANAYCGRGYAWFGQPGGKGGCQKLRCRPGDKLDDKTGWCIPKEQLAKQAGVQLGQGQTLGCPAGQVLVVDGGLTACVPAAQSCAKDEVYNGQACQKTGQCPTGQVLDPAQGRCVPFATPSGGDEIVVDVTTWAMTTYGPPNGPGAPSFCSQLAKRPHSFGISAGVTAAVRVTVMLSFPNAEVAKGQAQSAAVFAVSGNPVPPSGAQEVQSAVLGSFTPLVAGGGRASTLAVTTTVQCTVTNASTPVVVNEESGGF
jgi:hypothetical protein